MAAFEFRLLGPLEVWCGGRQLALRGRKPRAVLAMLLLRAGETVSTDRLIDGLWGEQPPTGALNALQAHVAALRRDLDPGRANGSTDGMLVTHRPGYRLRVEREAIDTVRFERLAAQGRAAVSRDPDQAARLLREALGLWRGPALAEFAYDRFAQAEANRLEELRLDAVQARVEADLALGDHAALVPELEALLAEHPLREQLAGQLMTALYRCGRQADACRVFHDTRAALVEELGIHPQPALRQLLQRVLDHDPSLALEASNDRAHATAPDRTPTTCRSS
jgi:DNA-binding SARP family transcriptional activator